MIPIEVRRMSNPKGGEVFTYQTTLKLRPRDHEMLVALLDASSGEIYSSRATFAR